MIYGKFKSCSNIWLIEWACLLLYWTRKDEKNSKGICWKKCDDFQKMRWAWWMILIPNLVSTTCTIDHHVMMPINEDDGELICVHGACYVSITNKRWEGMLRPFCRQDGRKEERKNDNIWTNTLQRLGRHVLEIEWRNAVKDAMRYDSTQVVSLAIWFKTSLFGLDGKLKMEHTRWSANIMSARNITTSFDDCYTMVWFSFDSFLSAICSS